MCCIAAREIVYTPEPVGGATATALQYAHTTGCAAVVRHPLFHLHAAYFCAVNSINSKKVSRMMLVVL